MQQQPLILMQNNTVMGMEWYDVDAQIQYHWRYRRHTVQGPTTEEGKENCSIGT